MTSRSALVPVDLYRQDPSRPFTGTEYLASLRDDRAVYLNGERVADVTTHPAFRNAARSIARLYDALHEGDQRDVLTTETDTGNGGYTHRFFKPARSVEDLRAQRGAIGAWSRMTYGWMGRTPDFKAAFTNTLGGNAQFYGEFADNARTWHRWSQDAVPFINHAIVNPPVDRGSPAETVRDVNVRVVEELAGGVVVSGAKVVATGAALSQVSFVGQSGSSDSADPEMAIMFMMPMNSPGCTLVCRASYEGNAAASGSPFDYPLSSRFDENDAIFILDNVFVPWENVLVYRDLDRVRRFYRESGFMQGFCLQSCTRFAVKLDFMAGLLARALHVTGGDVFRGNQVLLGEVVALRNTFWALSDAMVGSADPWVDGTVLPNQQAAFAYRVSSPDAFPRVREIVQKIVASALIYLPATGSDLYDDQIGAYLERYVRGSNGIGAAERIKVMKLLWDTIGTEFAGRHELYERNYAGNHEEVRLQCLRSAQGSGLMDGLTGLVDQCLEDYDEHGWRTPAWVASNAPRYFGVDPGVESMA
ncbi:4-hydroxyphenylacetate 3-hydroxylase N-terminal domain-containing protein [Rugosimonospora africana]|uniref:Pyoverdin chromophore biosynthetic protein pvcC n=1 Tax=Rugosimonospora africana TaxID=556532 RepID=A0A8J3QVF1_9ACTN|nr:4-hydroxyphenylacetate 3-hydroxylase N-terminal domain-containing protein [Rugosimonospora africana]GIH17129.1 pyoverdin chromophore biosynthetic protein pvcC [Rugosimonospora africana]